ncbi:MAG: uroporphyrinogen decarboxylase [Micavibrio sp.]|nr:uroporphyrinogen decarboxylase [Micavibrio sp.]|tara:strand:+ start:1131 stop:2156 length:1026 start_codon:yes stop_codon:yes gene_type:complete
MLNQHKPFLKTLSGKKQDKPPFWFMRQAGRYLPEYRALRAEKGGFLAMAFDPKAACEITMQPIRRFEMDAAIIFSDILTIPMALGQHLEFVAGEGPKLGELNISKLKYDDDILQPVYEALSKTSAQLKAENYTNTALIGFSGAPWTVATYMIEGGSSKDFMKTKLFAYQQPDLFDELIEILTNSTAQYLIKQVEAGAETLQIFDSWAGALDAESFEKYSIEPIKKIISQVREKYPDIPIIGFPKGAGTGLIKFAKQTGITAIGLDSQTHPQWAAQNLQSLMPVQGNLDPMMLMAGGEKMQKAAALIMENFASKPYIFNLGHGIHKDTPIAHVEKLVETLRG